MGETELFNLALDASGSRHTISTPTERSREAQTCARWYDISRRNVLRAAYWPDTETQARLALLVERDVDEDWVAADPTPGWRFAYSIPDKMLAPRYISDYSRFRLGRVGSAKAIMSQTEDAVLTFTQDVTDPDAWDPSLQLAIIYALAAQITMPLQGKPARAQLNAQKANDLIMQARVNAANTNDSQQETYPEWITARGYGVTNTARYVYPMGAMISVLEGVPVT